MEDPCVGSSCLGGQLNKAEQNQNNNNKTEFVASLINVLSYRRLMQPSKQAWGGLWGDKKKGVKEFVFDIIIGFLGNTETNFFKVGFRKPK